MHKPAFKIKRIISTAEFWVVSLNVRDNRLKEPQEL